MSLLITRDYANKATPMWLATSGGTVDGNLTVGGQLIVDGAATFNTGAGAPNYVVLDLSGNITAEMSHQAIAEGDAGDGLVLSADLITFNKVGTNQGNTTFVPSVYGANADNFTLGGTLYANVGPVPTQLITSTKTVNPVAVPPAAPSQFGVDLSLSGVSNAEYDVQATGTVYVVSGAVDPSDTVLYQFTSGTSGIMNAIVYPGQFNVGGNYVSGSGPLTSGGAAASVQMRARVSPSVSGTVLGANVKAFPAGGSTAVYGATLTLLDVQRVR